MPSMRSLMRLVPTVTVFAWCLMASTGRARKLIACPRQVNIALSILAAVPFWLKSSSKSETGKRPDRYLSSKVKSEMISDPMASGNCFFAFWALNDLSK